jgi:sulfite oxidase
VYDITDFVAAHPGGEKILMAVGARVEPYWELYAQHFTEDVMHILEEMRVGTLHVDDVMIKVCRVVVVPIRMCTDGIEWQ